MKKNILLLLSAIVFCSCSNKQSSKVVTDSDRLIEFEVISCSDTVIHRGSDDTEDICYGFEGGRTVKINGVYHMITSEMLGDPRWVKMRTGHWSSKDGIIWKRISTIKESDANFTGNSQRAAIWGPMNVFNEEDNHWHLFYVCYKSLPDTTNMFRLNFDGVIQHAVSEKEGLEGVDGPYIDKNILMRYDDPDKGYWEGLQGTDSFFPYKVGNKWYAFYGSATTQDLENCQWQIGLASSDLIDGPWKRMHEKNPTNLKGFAENPIVYQLDNGLYIAIVDGGHFTGQKGYTLSWDGINWSNVRHIALEPHITKWWSLMRTPQSLIKEDDGTYTMFFTAYKLYPDGLSYGCVSKLKLKINYLTQ